MDFPEVHVSGHGMDVTDAMSTYITSKLRKHARIFDIATRIDVEFVSQISARGVTDDYKVEITVHLPKAPARVEKSGSDVYAIIDEITDVLVRKIKRYKDKLRQWEGKDRWEDMREGDTSIEAEEDHSVGIYEYSPRVVERKTVEDCMPMTSEEAIERMELLDESFFLFKRKETGQYAVVYRLGQGTYGIAEVCE